MGHKQPTFLTLDPTPQPHSYTGRLFCQGCGSSLMYGDQAPCTCDVVLCESCVECQDGWHCLGELEEFAADMKDLADALRFAADGGRWDCASGHTAVKGSRRSFMRSTTGFRTWTEAGIILAECKRCHSTLALAGVVIYRGEDVALTGEVATEAVIADGQVAS